MTSNTTSKPIRSKKDHLLHQRALERDRLDEFVRIAGEAMLDARASLEELDPVKKGATSKHPHLHKQAAGILARIRDLQQMLKQTALI